MLNKIYQVLLLTLAINFLAVASGVAWLWQSGRLGEEQVCKVKEVLFAPTEAKNEVKLEEPPPSTQPLVKLDEMLAKASGRSAAEQVEFIQQAFDTQRGELDRRFRELEDLQRQVDLAKAQLATDRSAHEMKERQLADQQQAQQKLADDKGFQDSLNMYQAMPAKQAKSLFMDLDDETVVRYLQAMQPRTASRILKEFKTPAETDRIQRVLERMRHGQASASD